MTWQARSRTKPRRSIGRHVHTARLDVDCPCGKVAYASRGDADRAAKVATRQNGTPMRSYHCDAGACWHIANERKK